MNCTPIKCLETKKVKPNKMPLPPAKPPDSQPSSEVLQQRTVRILMQSSTSDQVSDFAYLISYDYKKLDVRLIPLYSQCSDSEYQQPISTVMSFSKIMNLICLLNPRTINFINSPKRSTKLLKRYFLSR